MPVAASAAIRSAADLWSPVRAASNSIASNSSRLSTATSPTYPSARASNAGVSSGHPSAAGTFQRVPETATQRMADLVVEQRVNRKHRPLQEPRLQVRRHPRLASEHRLKPQAWRIPAHRLTEVVPFAVCRLDGFGQRDGDRLRRADGRHGGDLLNRLARRERRVLGLSRVLLERRPVPVSLRGVGISWLLVLVCRSGLALEEGPVRRAVELLRLAACRPRIETGGTAAREPVLVRRPVSARSAAVRRTAVHSAGVAHAAVDNAAIDNPAISGRAVLASAMLASSIRASSVLASSVLASAILASAVRAAAVRAVAAGGNGIRPADALETAHRAAVAGAKRPRTVLVTARRTVLLGALRSRAVLSRPLMSRPLLRRPLQSRAVLAGTVLAGTVLAGTTLARARLTGVVESRAVLSRAILVAALEPARRHPAAGRTGRVAAEARQAAGRHAVARSAIAWSAVAKHAVARQAARSGTAGVAAWRRAILVAPGRVSALGPTLADRAFAGPSLTDRTMTGRARADRTLIRRTLAARTLAARTLAARTLAARTLAARTLAARTLASPVLMAGQAGLLRSGAELPA